MVELSNATCFQCKYSQMCGVYEIRLHTNTNQDPRIQGIKVISMTMTGLKAIEHIPIETI